MRRLTPFATLLVLGSTCVTHADPPRTTASEMFMQSLTDAGLDSALARLRAALADTTEPYPIDGRELARELPRRLVLAGRPMAATALLEGLEVVFDDADAYWLERARGYLWSGRQADAEAALHCALELSSGRADYAWMLRHLDRLQASATAQVRRQGRFAPGAATGVHGPYLGQPAPGRVPEVFAPGIVSTLANDYHISFTPDGHEIYVSRSGVGTLVSRWGKDGWTEPEVLHLIDADHLTEEANVSPDGGCIVFCGRASLREPRQLYRAWRQDGGWGVPQRLFPGMYGTQSRDGVLYYTDSGQRPDYGVIVMRLPAGDGFGEPRPLANPTINSPAPDAHPCISPDGDLLLFDSYREPGGGIYASFRQPDGTWGDAIFLNEILDVPPCGQCALSPDGRYLFFSLDDDIYWVDATFLSELRQTGRDF